MPHAPASHDFSGSSAKAALSDEGSLNEESLCKESKLAEAFCEETFEGWPLGAIPWPPAASVGKPDVAAFGDTTVGSTTFAGTAAETAAFSNESAGSSAFTDAVADTSTFADAATSSGETADVVAPSGETAGSTAFAGASIGSTTFAGTIAATGFPQFTQNLAPQGSFAPHFVQYMPVVLCLIRFFSFDIVNPDALGTCQRPHYARMPPRFFYPIYSPFQDHAL